MNGIPCVLQTKQDYENCHALAMAGNCDPQAMVRHWQGLLATTRHLVFDRVLAAAEPPDGPEPDYLVLVQEDGTRRQERLVDNPAAMLYALGYTAIEAEVNIAELEVL